MSSESSPIFTGQRLWNGAIVTPQLAETYNRLQDRIESFRAEGRNVPVELVNGSHKIIAEAQ
ncbi:hypothetical protein C0081_13840 [Cohaesibacter celericrescens]|uniref:Uncharacterized protein n=1 Tax=Cohaesibacter celericrescens TaxID=2067669 RepID=A0A2N5XQ35_9HYPH|nr:hypothetical protein C0081_13840 [Cohaesibacter celericrescens]